MLQKLHKAQKRLAHMMGGVELLISLLVIVGILCRLATLPAQLFVIPSEGMGNYLQYLFDILIAVELIKLLCSHDLSSMIEVLMFAVSWHLIIDHLTAWEIMVAVLSIAILFAIRKFLFIHVETYEEEKKRRSGLEDF